MDPPQPNGWFSQIVADNPPVVPENHNVHSAHPPVLLAGVREPSEPHSMHPLPNERATAMPRSHHTIRLTAQWHRTPAGVVPS